MNILLVNPPNCGRSIPEEKYGILSFKQIFRGEPLALTELAGNLLNHDVRIVDLKVDPSGLERELSIFRPDLVGITGVTCEANTVVKLAEQIKKECGATIVVGGIHASNDPQFFNRTCIDFIVVGVGKKAFANLVCALEEQREDGCCLPGVIRTTPGSTLKKVQICNRQDDIVEDMPPAYHLVSRYRSHYILEKLQANVGFVSSAFGCPYSCSFCCIAGQTGGKYLTKSVDAVVRDIRLLGDIPIIRLVDANTFGDIDRAKALCQALAEAKIQKHYLADIRSDTVVRHPEMLAEWKQAGLRALIIGFEEIQDSRLTLMNKANKIRVNMEAITILKEMGITIVGDFIISPEYEEDDFERLARYLEDVKIELPMITVMTPLPGTPLYLRQKAKIVNDNLDYYTLTNAVTPTKLEEGRFYKLYAELLRNSHKNARI